MTDEKEEAPLDPEMLRRLEIPDGVSPAAFRNVLVAYRTAYQQHGRIPSVKQVYDLWPRMAQGAMGTIMASHEFADAAKLLGIEVDDLGGLTREQHMAIAVLADPFDRHTIQNKLKRIGVPMGRYLNWKRNPLFMDILEQETAGAYKQSLPEIRARLIEQAEAGNMKAMELVLAKSGEWDPQAREQQNAQMLVMRVVEAVLRHVKDVDTRRLILEDIRSSGPILQIGAPPQQ